MEIPPALQGLNWFRLEATLRCERTPPAGAAHPFTVLDAVVKGVTSQALRQAGPLLRAEVFFHLPGLPHTSRLQEGRAVPCQFFFCQAAAGFPQRWRDALAAFFAPGGEGSNFTVTQLGEPETRDLSRLLAGMEPLPEEGELCLEFLSPLPFTPVAGKPRTYLDAPGLLELFTGRLRCLFSLELPPPPSVGWSVLPIYWDYVEYRHPSRSQPEGTRYINGCAGKLYLKGSFASLLPLLALGSELHAGTRLSCSQGYYQLHGRPAPFFNRFPDRLGILSAILEALARHDQVAAELALDLGGAADEEAWADRLRAELAEGRYEALPAQAFTVPKRDGGERTIEQLRGRDLIVQRYLLATLAGPMDRLFEPGSAGYRKGYSRQRAAAMIHEAITGGARFVLESDIDDFFPSVRLEILEQLLDGCIPAGDSLLRLALGRCIRTPVLQCGQVEPRRRGLPQGAPLSPLLTNLYLDSLDERAQQLGVRMIRYADDFVILTTTRAEAESALAGVTGAMAEIGLAVNQVKTAIRPVGEGFSFLGFRFGASGLETCTGTEDLPPYRKPLYITEPYLFLGMDGDTLEVRRGGALAGSFPLRRLSEVIVLAPASFSSAVAARCAREGIPFTLTLEPGKRLATLWSVGKTAYETAAGHLRRYGELGTAGVLAVAQEVVAAKLLAYAAMFRGRRQVSAAPLISRLEGAARDTAACGSLDELRGLEGAAARAVFAELNRQLQVDAFRSPRRERHPPDRLNSLLNFGYFLLFGRINAEFRTAGLNPYLGFLHSPENRYESLVCDIQELFRARVDALVMRLVNTRAVAPNDFVETAHGHYLAHDKSHVFIQRFEAAMEHKHRGSLSVNDAISAQVRSLARWAAGAGPLRVIDPSAALPEETT